ncbi:hypothetical protein [Mesorhizobium sp. M1182]|uniref:hypothetical protein n=1 Tax=Mesorhizobium sp. M1182 TaxID=2957067 RepID=UPI0033370CCD
MPADRNALVAEIRGFNRFYTRLIGLLDLTLTHSAYTLGEARLLFELGGRSRAVANSGGEAGFLHGRSTSIYGRRPPKSLPNSGSIRPMSRAS